jgi:exodeoxyribonuclease VII large subunit
MQPCRAMMLKGVYEYESFFDAVVIIRGGGSQSDLNCFNNYEIAYHITQFPLPVLTGIGHEQDDTVTDMVAHTRLKTPTAVAAFIIDTMALVDENLKEIQGQIFSFLNDKVENEKGRLALKGKDFQIIVANYVSKESARLLDLKHLLNTSINHSLYRNKIRLYKSESDIHKSLKLAINSKKNNVHYITGLFKNAIKYKIAEMKNTLEDNNTQINHLDPGLILKRGYSITLKNGKVIKDETNAAESDIIETILYKGRLISQIKNRLI